jgi:hypothetical protein
MRRGYWRIQLRRLRHRVAAGATVFTNPIGTFVIETVIADDDASLEGELRLAEDAQRNLLIVDAGTTRVTMVDAERCACLRLNVELAALIDALHSTAAFGIELGPVIDVGDIDGDVIEWDGDRN